MKAPVVLFLIAFSATAEVRTLTLRDALDIALKQNPDVVLARLDLGQRAAGGIRSGKFHPRHGVNDGRGELPPGSEVILGIVCRCFAATLQAVVRFVIEGEAIEVGPIVGPYLFGGGHTPGKVQRVNDLDIRRPGKGEQGVNIVVAQVF